MANATRDDTEASGTILVKVLSIEGNKVRLSRKLSSRKPRRRRRRRNSASAVARAQVLRRPSKILDCFKVEKGLRENQRGLVLAYLVFPVKDEEKFG